MNLPDYPNIIFINNKDIIQDRAAAANGINLPMKIMAGGIQGGEGESVPGCRFPAILVERGAVAVVVVGLQKGIVDGGALAGSCLAVDLPPIPPNDNLLFAAGFFSFHRQPGFHHPGICRGNGNLPGLGGNRIFCAKQEKERRRQHKKPEAKR